MRTRVFAAWLVMVPSIARAEGPVAPQASPPQPPSTEEIEAQLRRRNEALDKVFAAKAAATQADLRRRAAAAEAQQQEHAQVDRAEAASYDHEMSEAIATDLKRAGTVTAVAASVTLLAGVGTYVGGTLERSSIAGGGFRTGSDLGSARSLVSTMATTSDAMIVATIVLGVTSAACLIASSAVRPKASEKKAPAGAFRFSDGRFEW